MATFSQDLAAAELWPIKIKGKIQRLSPMGDPAIEQFYHQTMVQGQFTERSIGEAQHWLAQKQKDLMEKIMMHLKVNMLAVDGQLSNPARAIKFAADSIKILNDVNVFQREIVGLIAAVNQNITMLLQIEAAMLSMVMQNLNALAHLLQMICNWHLPKLPSFPHLFPEGIWHWNGIQFVPLSAFANLIKNFLKSIENFSFNMCSVTTPSGLVAAISQNPPSSVSTYSGLNIGTTLIIPPLDGGISPTGQELADPSYLSLMQGTTTSPIYLSPADSAYNDATPFNTNSSMLGSLPDPSTIISNYQMPPATYQNNIVCVVPQTRYVTDSTNLQKTLTEYINLGEIVASNFDPNITAEWLFYLNLNRIGRAGSWLANFQGAYTTYIIPSLTYLENTPVPWNCVLPSTTVNDAPTAIPLLTTLTGASPFVQGNLLWRLSYIEASLLGYTRNTTWDSYASGDYVSGFTGTDLDYRATTINTTTTTVTLGAMTAEYPVDCTFPSAIGSVLQEVIAIASINIQNTPSYTTNRPQYKYVFNQFALATEVDRFTQFWRTFNANLQALLLQDPYLIQFVVTYSGALDSAIDPLGDSTIYTQIQTDAATRNRSWTPGGSLLSIPDIPDVNYTTQLSPTQTGWTGTTFDPAIYLSRPDIQQLPIPTQLAMLRTNLSYAAVQQMGQTISNSIQASIQQSQALIQSFQNLGFKVEVVSAVDVVPPGLTGLQVSFDQVDFDLTENVTSPSTFTIQKAGNYAMTVLLNWGTGSAGVRTGIVFLNGTTVLATSSTDGTQVGPTSLQMSLTPYFNEGDVVTIVAIHNLAVPQTVVVGSYVAAILTDTTPPSTNGGVPSNNGLSLTRTFIADSTLTPLMALAVGADGNVSAIDPTTVQTDGEGNPVYPIVTGVTLSSATAGGSVIVGTYYGGVYEYDGANFTVGGLLYAGVGGVLTQDYTTVAEGSSLASPPTSPPLPPCLWVVVVGRAITPNQFIYEPHIPNLTNLGTF